MNIIEAWLEMKSQLPELPIEGIGAKYIYPFFVALIVLEYFRAKELFDLKESWAGFVMGSVATLIKVIANVFEISLYLFLFAWAAPFREDVLGYSSLGWAWYTWVICLVLDDHNFYWHHRIAHNVRILWAAHLPHHSGKMFNLTVSIRNGWFIALLQADLLALDALVGLRADHDRHLPHHQLVLPVLPPQPVGTVPCHGMKRCSTRRMCMWYTTVATRSTLTVTTAGSSPSGTASMGPGRIRSMA
jgi:sterol desaturase/sphingolipid hydroxylase (fatty acid hydroxylase superfamily)